MQTTKNFNFVTKINKWFDPNSPVFTTRLSLIICVILASNGLYLGITENSLAVQINGLISAIDVLNSFIFLTAVNHSVRSPDYIYNYGYGKYESLSLLAAAGLLILVLGYTIFEAYQSFGTTETEGSNSLKLLTFSIVSLAIMGFMFRLQKKAAKKYKLPILDYDAEIWKIDSLIELVVLANLILGAILKYNNKVYLSIVTDSLTAVFLLIFALKVPLKGSKDALNQLLDKTLPENVQFEILAVVAENLNKMCEFRTVHTRQSGKDIFIELDVVMPYDFTISQKFEVEKEIQAKLKELYPTCVPRVYTIPCPGDCNHNGHSSCPVKKYMASKNQIEL